MKFEDITGNRYGRLLVIGYKHTDNRSYSYLWECKCDCGNFVITNKDTLKSGDTKSCGCLRKEMTTTHNKSRSKIYKLWNAMRNRCYNSKDGHYKYYGGRGITVCQEWHTFENFYKDMGDRPKGKSLDRIDNNGNYCKENCRWATKEEQSKNTRKTKFIEFNGKKQCISDWAKELNISKNTLYNRIFVYKWSIEKSLTTPKIDN